MIGERSAKILDCAVREFIDRGEAVSSGLLYRRYRFGIKPAMIRAELLSLTKEGYLEQPYHSAGRVPTNKGFEFFASRVLEQAAPVEGEAEEFADLLAGERWGDMVGPLSERFGTLSIVGRQGGDIYKGGFERLMSHFAWDSRDALMGVVRDFEMIDERLRGADEMFQEDFLDVFIGRKSPVTKSDELAVVAADCDCGNSRVFLLAIGPKRMHYGRAASVFRGLKDVLQSRRKKPSRTGAKRT